MERLLPTIGYTKVSNQLVLGFVLRRPPLNAIDHGDNVFEHMQRMVDASRVKWQNIKRESGNRRIRTYTQMIFSQDERGFLARPIDSQSRVTLSMQGRILKNVVDLTTL